MWQGSFAALHHERLTTGKHRGSRRRQSQSGLGGTSAVIGVVSFDISTAPAGAEEARPEMLCVHGSGEDWCITLA